jgi:predicted Zn-dependent peptidase
MIRAFREIVFYISVFAVLAAPAAFSQATLPEPKQEKLLNGLKVLMWPDAKADKVAIKLRIHSGSAFDPQGKEGLMQMLSDNLFPNESTREFFREDLGGDLEVITNYDYIQINASSKPESFLTMLETIATDVSNPTIDKETTANLRAALAAKVASFEADPAYVADQAVAKRLFGTFPYGRPEMGTGDSLKKIDFSDLTDAKNRFLTADNATLAISGNFDKTNALRAARRLLGGWQKSDKKVPATFRQPDEPDTKPLKIEFPDLQKNYTREARTAPARGDKDYFAMQVLTRIWQDTAGYSNNDESGCGRGHYQANLLRGVHVFSRSRPIPKDGELLPSDTRNTCGLWLLSPYVPYDSVIKRVEKQVDVQAYFDKAKTRTILEFDQTAQNQSGLSDLWLDIDTFKLISVDDESRKIKGVTLSDVSQLVDRLRKSPMVTVLVTSKTVSN